MKPPRCPVHSRPMAECATACAQREAAILARSARAVADLQGAGGSSWASLAEVLIAVANSDYRARRWADTGKVEP